jgi:hypothetical protein
MIGYVRDEIEHMIRCGAGENYIANIIAVDILRRCGVTEREKIVEFIKGEYPKVYDIIQKDYPHRL